MSTLASGTRLGPYQILEPLGAGGMGEVYKAADTRLDRVVAVKLLVRHWADDPDMRARFSREAQIVASLNHPNICVLHDIGNQDGTDFLVMEYLEGETLAKRLERGPLDLDEALAMGLAIADALDKAHRRGVIHRDLKPHNVILTASGPKLLDFGLAKVRAVFTSAGSSQTRPTTPIPASQAPTLTNLTVPGMMIGTLQYMAPEQLEGLDADPRTDIFAFGALLYEMITGKRAFEGKTRILIMSAIATSDPPPLASIQPAVTQAVEHVVKTCLAKDPNERWQTARDMLAELEWASHAGAGIALSHARAHAGRLHPKAWIPLAVAGLLLLATALPAAMYFRGPRASEEFRMQIPLSGTAQPYDRCCGNAVSLSRATAGTNVDISPDGRLLAFVSRADNNEPWALYVRPVGSVAPQKLVAIDDAAPFANQPFWSPDSRFVGYVSGGKLMKIEASGGPAQLISEAQGFSGGTWNRDGVILFGTSSGLLRVSAEGGKPEAVTTLAQGEGGHFWPHFLPDGKHYLYTVWDQDSAKRAVMAGALGTKEKTRVVAAESNASFAEPGFLVFRREDAVYAQPFSAKKLAVSGEPERIADQVAFNSGNGLSAFRVSPGGVLVYFQSATGGAGPAQDNNGEWQLVWADSGGSVKESIGPPGVYRGMEVSPDGKRIAVHRHDANGGDVIVIEPDSSTKRLTFDAMHHNSSPIWSPTGDRIAYSAVQKGKWGIYQTLSSGSGTEEVLYESETLKAPMSWSPDGKRIVFWQQDSKSGGDLWVLTLDDKKAAPLIATPANETHGQISPDGKWIAYTSNSVGARNEVFVQPFPNGSGRYQISFHGGDWPRWRGDSKVLYFHSIATNPDAPASTGRFRGGSLYSTDVSVKGQEFISKTPAEFVRTWGVNYPHSGGDYQTYGMKADGKLILTLQLAATTTNTVAAGDAVGPDPPLSITVAMNWTASLKK